MAAGTVSARIDERTRHAANALIREAGLTPGDVIRGVWDYIAITGDIPAFVREERVQRGPSHAFKTLSDLTVRVADDAPLACMTAHDVKMELMNRDL